MWTVYVWVVPVYNELYGAFLTKIENGTQKEHEEFLSEVFPSEKFKCLGQITEEKADELDFICFQKTLDNSDSF